MSVKVVTPPAEEPVSLAEAKLHCRVDHDEEDTLISGLIAAARGWAEAYTWRGIALATRRYSLDAFPNRCEVGRSRRYQWTADPLVLPFPELAEVTSIEYVDDDGVTQAMDEADYTADADSEPARIFPAYGTYWPSTRAVPNAVKVTYTSGYTDATSVPAELKTAILLLVGHWYVNREAVVTGTITNDVQLSATALLDPYRVMT